jgi:hypothetical protein
VCVCVCVFLKQDLFSLSFKAGSCYVAQAALNLQPSALACRVLRCKHNNTSLFSYSSEGRESERSLTVLVHLGALMEESVCLPFSASRDPPAFLGSCSHCHITSTSCFHCQIY